MWYYLWFIPLINGFSIPHIEQVVHCVDQWVPIIHEKYKSLGEYQSWVEPNIFSTYDHFLHHKQEYINQYKSNILHQNYIKEFLVKKISSTLPHVDTIGHKLLQTNRLFVEDTLKKDYIPNSIKKKLILFNIRAMQYGDNMGSEILEYYYKTVDYLLDD